jgi:hypothetical protein
MNMKTILVAINVLIGSLYLGFPVFYGIVAFNAIFWMSLLYEFTTSDENELVDKLLTKRKVAQSTSEQIAFERFLVRNFVESNFTDPELTNSEIRSIEQHIVPPIEA